jgi:PAS domain S-box-containing protein
MGNGVLRGDDIARQLLYGWAHPYIRTTLTGLVVAVAYYLSARAGLALTFQPDNLVAFWPPATILLVALLNIPARQWWVVLLASLPPHVIAMMQVGRSGFFSAVFGLLTWLGAWTAVAALRRSRGEPWRLARLQDFYLYTLCAVIGGPVLVASAGTALQAVAQGSAGSWATWRMWFLANALVHLTLSPALLIWITSGIGWLKSVSPRRYGEVCLLSIALLVVGLEAFGGEPGGPDNLPLLLYAPVLLLLWAAVRFGPRGAASALSFIACLSIWNAVHGRGPFTEQSPVENVLTLQLFLIGVAVSLLVLAILIQERQRTEEALRASEERYRTIVDEQTELICRYRPDTTLTFVNEAYCRYFGKTREELIGQSFLSLIPDEARQDALEHVHSLCEKPRIQPYEHPVLGANGKIRWQQWVDQVTLHDNGRMLELQAVGRDITERKQAEEALRRAEAKFRAVFEANFVPLCFWHRDGRILEANDAYLCLTGFTRAELEAGQAHWDALTLPEEIYRTERAAAELAAGKESSTPYEKVYRLRDGRRIPVLLAGALLAGYTDRGVAYTIDLSELKRAEAALQRAQAELAHAARVMTMGELLASLAHELMQPLTAILSNAQAALRFLNHPPADLHEVRAILADIVADDQRAGEVIQRLRQLLMRGELERLPLDINEVIQNVVKLIHGEIVIKNVGMILDLGSDLPPVPGDRVQLQQVILNLLMNGIEAMSPVKDRPRELLIQSRRHEVGGVLVAVRDAGIGLDPQQVERIFDSFYTTKPKGMGLGLSISRSIVEAHGGQLWASPNTGYGTTFQFTLPAADEHVV